LIYIDFIASSTSIWGGIFLSKAVSIGNVFAQVLPIAQKNPWTALILYFALLGVLAIIPGGVVPSFLKYRGARKGQDILRQEDVEKIVKKITKREASGSKNTKSGARKRKRK
tara:strand:+ start:85 stop:420 length:336 start_codon:yes stop_codon:yes gene_type:complete